MLSKLLRLGRRQLHTIVSREIIKPSSPTPSHSRTYNLSLLDQMATDSHSPFVAFYANNLHKSSQEDKTLELKNSLSKTLTQYYPFAGRMKKTGPSHVDCNDDGVEYIEASIDVSLSDFLQQSKYEDFDPLFPNGLIWFESYIRGDTEGFTCPLAVQFNRFACGGVAVASTLSHKVGDGRCLLNFINHWATVTARKDTSLINPQILHHQHRNINLPPISRNKSRVGCVTRSFLFPSQKLNNLKAKVRDMTMESGQPIMNLTRFEALSWLLHSRLTAAATKKNSGNFKESGMICPLDMTSILAEKLSGTSIGNLYFVLDIPTTSQSDIEPHNLINEMKKRKTRFQSIPNFETANESIAHISSDTILNTIKRVEDYYIYSSVYRFPLYDIDFGWGKPVKVTITTMKNFIVLMAAPDGNGIEACMCLEKEEMEILQSDPELLAFCS